MNDEFADYWSTLKRARILADEGKTVREIIDELRGQQTGMSKTTLHRNVKKIMCQVTNICPRCGQVMPPPKPAATPAWRADIDTVEATIGIRIYERRGSRILAQMIREGTITTRDDVTYAQLISQNGCGKITARQILDMLTNAA